MAGAKHLDHVRMAHAGPEIELFEESVGVIRAGAIHQKCYCNCGACASNAAVSRAEWTATEWFGLEIYVMFGGH